MSVELRTLRVHLAADTFAREHGVVLPRHLTKLTLGNELARGGFGVLRPLEAMDDARPRFGLLVKLFSPDVVAGVGGESAFHARVGRLIAALEIRQDVAWTRALLSVPVCMATGDLSGTSYLFAIMLDLRPLGYRESPFSDAANTAAYMGRDPRDRLALAISFARRAAFLEELGFLHGDLNPENLMVSDDDVQIIDFDAGTVVESGREHPVTAGKPDDCMPPEVKPTCAGGVVDLDRYTLSAERWSIGSLVGYLLFGAHPAFFLRSISREAIDAYAREPGGWPIVDTGGPLFTRVERNRRAYTRMRAELQELPVAAHELFSAFFAAGLDGGKRPAAADWAVGLASLTAPAVIERFDVDRDLVPEGATVVLGWAVRNASEVVLDPYGSQPPSGSLQVVVDESATFTLRAANAYTQATRRTVGVRVVPLPRIEWLPCPEFPGLGLGPRPREAVAGGARSTLGMPVLPAPPTVVTVLAIRSSEAVPGCGPRLVPPPAVAPGRLTAPHLGFGPRAPLVSQLLGVTQPPVARPRGRRRPRSSH